jgi:3-hydroxyisobutyryl-CoA hydrolase
VALIHGFTMGGGVGVSLHGKYRVATEKTVFSMPECAIGLFPDVGASHFLPQLRGELGVFLGLTGHRLKGYDTVAAGVATHYVPSERLEELKDALLAKGVDALDEICESHSPQPVEELCTQVDKYFNANSVEEIMAALQQDAGSNEWAAQQVKVLSRLSPTSLKITLHLLRNAPQNNRKACFENEFSLGSRVLQKPDFFEGVRAVLVDKDNQPKWTPDSLDKVDVDFYFKRDDKEKLLSFL